MDTNNKIDVKNFFLNQEDYLNEIFNKLPLGIIFCDKKGNIINTNESALNIIGIPKLDDILGINLFESPYIKDKKEELLRNGSVSFEATSDLDLLKELGNYHPTKKGNIFLDYTISVIDSGLMIQIKDITSFKANEEIYKVEKKFQTVLDSMTESFMIGELILKEDQPYDIKYLLVNQAAASAYHLKIEKIINKSFMELFPDLEVPFLKEIGEAVLNGKIITNKEYKSPITGDWAEFDIYPQDGNYFAILARVINERKKSEETLLRSEKKFRILLESSPMAIVVYRDSYLYVNQAAASILGYTKEEILNMDLEEIIHPDQREFVMSNIETLIKENQEKNSTEVKMITKAGNEKWFEVTSKIIQYEGLPALMLIGLDITKRKQMEEEIKKARDNLEEKVMIRTIQLEETIKSLAESELKFREIFYNANDIITLANINENGTPGNFIEVNETACKQLGYSREEFLKMTPFDIMSQDSVSEVPQTIKKLSEKNLATVEKVYIAKDGSEIPVEVNTHIFNLNGRKVALAISRDIKERKIAENKSRELINFQKTLFETIHSPIFYKDTKGIYQGCNKAYEDFLGLKKDQIIGKSVYDIFPKDQADKFDKMDSELLQNPGKQIYESQMNHADGSTHTVIFYKATYFNVDCTPAGLISVIVDISDRKKMEEEILRLADMVESSNDGIIGIDLNGVIFSWNKGAENVYGFKMEEMKGEHLIKIMNSQESAKVMNHLDEIKKGRTIVHYEAKRIRKDGKKIDISVTLSPIKKASKEIIGISAISKDITELKNTEKELKKIIIELKHSNEELQQFAYVSSHDLQEPLRTIASFTQLLERRYKGKLDSDADEFMDYIVEAAKRMKAQIEGLLEYSRVVTKGKEFETVDMNKPLNHAINILNILIGETKTEITCDKLPSVMGDELQLQRVFQNLISNAIKFRKEEKQLKIHVSTYKVEDGYIFSVLDNGIGIEKQYLERIFNIFQRLHTRDVYKGTGIGLAVVKRIIERHGGHVWVESEFGTGSTFYFTLPVIST